MLSFICECLAQEGFRVDAAENGVAADALLRQHHYRAVVSDVKLPGVGGLDCWPDTRIPSPRPFS